MILRTDDPFVAAAVAAIQRGHVVALKHPVDAHPELGTASIGSGEAA